MNWRKKKNLELPDTPSLMVLATQLGVNRRFSPRVTYPPNAIVCKLPEIFFADEKMKVHDISIGGCCLLDPDLRLGSAVGQDVELKMHWTTGTEAVRARVVSRVHDRRHMQFLDLSVQRQTWLNKSMVPGARGLSLSRHSFTTKLGPSMQVAELWSSPHGDNVVIEQGAKHVAVVHFLGEQFTVFNDSLPLKNSTSPCTKLEFEQLILFLANAPSPTPAIYELLRILEALLERGEKT